MQNVAYLERLKKLNLERLDVRRLCADLILTLADTPHNTRGHRYKLLATRTKKDTARYFFSQRVVKIWNNLPSSTDFMSLSRFKKHLMYDYLVDFCTVIV